MTLAPDKEITLWSSVRSQTPAACLLGETLFSLHSDWLAYTSAEEEGVCQKRYVWSYKNASDGGN